MDNEGRRPNIQTEDEDRSPLRHAYVRVGDGWPKGIPYQVGRSRDGHTLVHVAGRSDGVDVDVWWVDWFDEGEDDE